MPISMEFWTQLHSIGNIAAFIFGCTIFSRKKGDSTHVLLGYGFATGMLLSEGYSFILNDRGWNALHGLSALAIYWVIKGIHVVQLKPDNWLEQHVTVMGSAFISICIAGCGVAGRHLTLCRQTGLHWGWFMGAGAVVAIPLFSLYKRSLKLGGK